MPPEPDLRAVINALTGDTITVKVTNTLTTTHAFRIDGVVDTGPIAAGTSKTATFTGPGPGAYIHHDPGNAPINRILGLHGAPIVRAPGAPADAADYL